MSGYSYTTIPGPDGDDTIASQIGGLNDSGTVVAFFSNGTVSGEYIYAGGVYTTLSGPEGAGFSPAAEINDAGEVIGQYYPGGSPRGLIYDNGAYTPLNGPPDSGATETTADAINNSGTIAGSYYTGTNTYGFIYSNGAYTSLTGPNGANDVDVLPNAINSSGEIAGQINPTTTTSVGFIYDNGSYTLLTGPGENDSFVSAFAVNDSGEVLVSYTDGNGNAQSALYDDGAYTTFSGPNPGDTTVALTAIGNSGDVFGTYLDGNGREVAFVYHDGAYTTLSGPIAGDSLVSVVAVNAAGEIAGSATKNGVRIAFTAAPLCFLRGTRILTPAGEVLVEALAIGDAVVTRFGGIRRIKWIGRQTYESRSVKDDPARLPVCIYPGAFGDDGPAQKLFVSPGHSILIGGVLVLASALVNGVTVTQRYDQDTPAVIAYFQIELETHDCIIAEGVWAETYADAPGQRGQFDNEAEYYALYPDEPPPEELILCAPRPDRGEQRAAALRQVAAVAEASVTPGRFEGWIDSISDWRIEGWAIDHHHPELPVLLEVLAGGAVIGSSLACEQREDLVQAGIGNGRRAFFFTPSARLRPAIWPDVQMRRASDGAPLQTTEACRARFVPLAMAAE